MATSPRAGRSLSVAEVAAALAQFRIELSAPERGGGPAQLVEGASRRGASPLAVRPERSRRASSPLLTQPRALVLSASGTRPQLRRSPPARLTQAGIGAFLETLAA